MARFRTPLRYPGGKQKLSRFILEILIENNGIGWNYVEPYAGGAGVAIQLLLERRIGHAYLNDSYFPVYAFWKSILDETEKFCRKITSASMTVDEWRKQRSILQNHEAHSIFEVGFSMFYLNRCNRSGVLSGGVIGGLDQKGPWKMDARFSRNDLIQRIESIADRKKDITVHNLDAEEFMTTIVNNLPATTLVYCDPPYYEKASHLYKNSYKPDDHQRVANLIQNKLNKKWVVSYDGVIEIISCYTKRRAFLYELQYNASRAYKGSEVFIFSDTLKIPRESFIPGINDSLPNINKCAAIKLEMLSL